ncbi:hypothetical protein I4N56_005665 [Pseudomonas mohnii]|uniref:hypothetical protein n=1 Tax=Pseudomonas mohnii TaxID=395600 RepID=UPI0018DB0DB6|nr:hypothetical protein [Pseudomonas mohnii]MBH8610481.1 hypothetical protein [Pseudomonas mohnii]
MKYLLNTLSVLIATIGAWTLWIGGNIIVENAGNWYAAGTLLCLGGPGIVLLAKWNDR